MQRWARTLTTSQPSGQIGCPLQVLRPCGECGTQTDLSKSLGALARSVTTVAFSFQDQPTKNRTAVVHLVHLQEREHQGCLRDT